MVKVHKRTKNSRIRGARSCGWGFRQKHKGHGNRGGHGMAGSGKRADHKKQKAKQSDTKKKTYFGKQGLTSRGSMKVKVEKINLKAIKENIFKTNNQKINLPKHIILGTGEGFKAEITAKKASKSAIEKMEIAGGKIILPITLAKSSVKPKKVSSEEKKETVKESPVKEEKKETSKTKDKPTKKVSKKE